jgi:hypothetical protein
MVRSGQFADGGRDVEVVPDGTVVLAIVDVVRATRPLAQSVRETMTKAMATARLTERLARRKRVGLFMN